jgi:hopanoid biosynthesis associated RND transporter like protein HpnN
VKEAFEARAARWLCAWVDFVVRNARAVVALAALLTLGFGAYAALHLRVNSDNLRLIAEDLPFMQRHREFARSFPILSNVLIVVIDGENPEVARDAADALAGALAARPERFRDAFLPGGGAFFERYGLLYRSVEDLENFSDQLVQAQPLIAELERGGSLAELVALVRAGLERVGEVGPDPDDWASVLDRIGSATVQVYDEYPLSLSWEDLLLQGSALEVSARRVIVVEPILDFDSLLAGGRAIAEIREAARELGLVPERGVSVRVTGNPALNYEEMLGMAWDVGWTGLLSFAGVAVLVWFAFRSKRLVAAALITLVTGLVWTAAFAAAAIGHVNILSICFAVLFIGLGVDFTIHLGLHYLEARRRDVEHAGALRAAVGECGTSLVLCALTTSIGFYAFVPTDYLGVAELGLIAGTGMAVILVQTLTLLPALMSLGLQPSAVERHQALRRHALPGAAWLHAHPAGVLLACGVLAVGALALVPRLRFDPNVVRMRNPDTESVQAFNELLADRDAASPWTIEWIAPNLDAAIAKAREVRELPVVDRALTLADFVPADQPEKLEILADLRLLLEPMQPAAKTALPEGVEPQVAALRELHGFLDRYPPGEGRSPLRRSVQLLEQRLDEFLQRVEGERDPAAALARLEQVLLGNLPQQIARLRAALDPGELRLADLPPQIVQRMRAEDGRARLQIFARENLEEPGSLYRFVDTASERVPDGTGMAVDLVQFARTTAGALRQAFSAALLAILAIVWLLWRNLADTALVVIPLLLGSLLSAGAMAALGLSFNFANVLVIPLLLGVGVDTGIHLMHRSKSAAVGQDLLETVTARAAFYSAATTVASFGNLALSAHRGIRSLGIVLVVAMLFTLLANLVFLPALLSLRERRALARGGAGGAGTRAGGRA